MKVSIFLSIFIFLFFSIITVESGTVDTTKSVVDACDKVVKLKVLDGVRDNKLMKIIGTTLPGVSAGLKIFSVFDGIFNPKEPPNAEVLRQIEKLSQKLDEIAESIAALTNLIIRQMELIILNMKLQEYSVLSVKMQLNDEKFFTLLEVFDDANSTEFVERLTNLIEKQYKEKNEFEMVKLFDNQVSISKSIIQEFIEYGKLQKGVYESTAPTSTAKMIQDFYLDMLEKILRSYALREFAINLKHYSLPNDTSHDLELLLKEKSDVLDLFAESFRRTAYSLEDEDFKGYINLDKTGNDKMVRFKNVFQRVMVEEQMLAGPSQYTCRKECKDYRGTPWKLDGCFGTVWECYSDRSNRNHKLNQFYLQINTEKDRIYWSYNYLKEGWYGITENVPDSQKVLKYLTGKSKPFHECDICMCICDQTDHGNTLRKFYTGKQLAPKGYVVTGLRFIEYGYAIFLQIQVGELLPTSVVDENSVKWQEVDNSGEYTYIDYKNRYDLILDDTMTFNSPETVVTGIQLASMSSAIGLKMFGRSITNITAGTLSEQVETVTPEIYTNFLPYRDVPKIKEGGKNFTVDTNGRLKMTSSSTVADAGQNYVPYFDANDVQFFSAAPLSGVGLMRYTNDKDYSGFIKPVIRSMDFKALT